MTGTVSKAPAMRSDLDNYDGTLTTSRNNSSGGTTSGLKVGNSIDVLSVFGDGNTSNQTLATINMAISSLGSANVALEFAPGTWTIDDDLTIASNFTIVAPAGCVFDVSSGKTLTIQGVLFRQHNTYSSGSGTVTISGTDIIPTTEYGRGYSADTGAADAYVATPSPAITAYAAGQMFRFKAANANTGAATINVNGLGAKTIKKDVSTDLEANDITVNEVITVVYDGTNFQIIPTVGVVEAVTTSVIPSGTLMLFQQSAAPTGWTKQSTHNNKALRVVTGTASSGGNDSFSTVFGTSKSTDSYTLLEADIPGHTHGVGSYAAASGGAHTHTVQVQTQSDTGSGFTVIEDKGGSHLQSNNVAVSDFATVSAIPSGGAHSHSVTGTSASTGGDGGHSHDLTIDLEYVDVIICSKD